MHNKILMGVDPFATDSGRPKRITVIGAGVAGLVAAHELERLGHSVQVLEARLEVGGRIRTHRFRGGATGPHVELGAMRILASHHRTMRWIERLGLTDRLRPFKTLFADDAAYLATSSGHVRVREASPVLVKQFRAGLPAGRYREDTILFGAWLTASVEAIAPSDFSRSLRGDLTIQLLDMVDHIDLRPYIDAGRIDLNSFFADHPQVGQAGAGPLHRFLDDIATETSSALYRLSGGMDQIPLELAARIRSSVYRGREVVGIDVREDGVRLEIRHGFATFSRDCDYVLCTVPFPVLRRTRLTGVDESKLAVIANMPYWPATKIAFHCREPFWERDGIEGGGSFTGGLVGQTYYPPVDGDPRHGAVLLASYTLGSDADTLARMPRGARTSAVLAELGAVHPELLRPGMLLDTVSQAWGEDPAALGAAAVRWGKDAMACEFERRLAARPQGRLFFAGEHCSSHPAWIEGAIESALDAVQEIDRYQPDPRPTVLAAER